MIEKRDKGFQGGLFFVFLLCVLAALALYFVVRPAEDSTNPDIVNAVKVAAVMSIVLLLAAASQITNILPTHRRTLRPVLWGLLLALTVALSIKIPVITIAFGYYSVKALILLSALVVLELLVFVLLVIAKIDQPLPESHLAAMPPMAPPFPVTPPPEQLAPAEVVRYEEATLALEQAARDHEEATQEVDELARQYEERLR